MATLFTEQYYIAQVNEDITGGGCSRDGKDENSKSILYGQPSGIGLLEGGGHQWECNIGISLKEIKC
jgi:hypothetical protein